jgi:hypothetical protein
MSTETIKQTLSTIRAMGLAARWSSNGREYRVTWPHHYIKETYGLQDRDAREKGESLAYYTRDPQDAIDTAKKMVKESFG